MVKCSVGGSGIEGSGNQTIGRSRVGESVIYQSLKGLLRRLMWANNGSRRPSRYSVPLTSRFGYVSQRRRKSENQPAREKTKRARFHRLIRERYESRRASCQSGKLAHTHPNLRIVWRVSTHEGVGKGRLGAESPLLKTPSVSPLSA